MGKNKADRTGQEKTEIGSAHAVLHVKHLKKSHLKEIVPHPNAFANKYTRGKLVAVGGSAKYPGSIVMGSEAAYRMGAGYVEVVCAPETLPIVNAANPEAVATRWNGWNLRASHLDSEPDHFHPMACLVGSGMSGTVLREHDLILDILLNCKYPVIADGGAFNVLATDEGVAAAQHRKDKNLALIVTPHFGEAARLGSAVGIAFPSNPEARSDQENANIALNLARLYNATVLLKGADSYIASCDSPKVWCMTHGTPALAKAGTGDVLAGMVGALVAQGLDPVDSAKLASWTHAECGVLASRVYGDIGVCATDLPRLIGKALSNI